MQELYPFKPGVVSHLRDLDTFQTSYSFHHRPFDRAEQLCGPYWAREKRARPWLQSPKTDFDLQCREISRESQVNLQYQVVQLSSHNPTAGPPERGGAGHAAALPAPRPAHGAQRGPGTVPQPLPGIALHIIISVGRYTLQAREFYKAEPSSITRPVVAHLQQTCLV